jgi:tetratricopeptide (TPR) repeat protein
MGYHAPGGTFQEDLIMWLLRFFGDPHRLPTLLVFAVTMLFTGPARPATEGTDKDRRMVERLDEIRLLQAEVKDGHYDRARAALEYARAFANYGIDVTKLEPAEAAARIRKQAIRIELSVALDDWAACLPKGKQRQALLGIVRAADPDPWRNRLRETCERRDAKALRDLARDDRAARQPAVTHLLLANALERAGAVPEAIAVLRQGQKRYPADFWINHQLASCLVQLRPARLDEAVRFYTAALALRPNNPAVYVNLGVALHRQGKLDEAVASFRKAIALQPDFAQAYTNLGAALRDLGRPREAEAALRQAIRLQPANPTNYLHLGDLLFQLGKTADAAAMFRRAIELDPTMAAAYLRLGDLLRATGRPAEALAVYRKAIELDPKLEGAFTRLARVLVDIGRLDEAIAAYRKALEIDSPARSGEALLGLGSALALQGKHAEAVAMFRQAIRLRPDWAEAHCNLGLVLQRMGKFAEAALALKRGHELGSKQPRWPYPSARWLKDAEALARLDAELPDVLSGKATVPAAELAELAHLCLRYKHLPATAAHLYERAFQKDAQLDQDRRAGHRYNAACAAALAGTGQGGDAGKHDDKERHRLRVKALAWLRADLAGLDRASASKVLRHWQQDPDLARLRDTAALAQLVEDEQQAWKKLWADVAARVKQGEGKR